MKAVFLIWTIHCYGMKKRQNNIQGNMFTSGKNMALTRIHLKRRFGKRHGIVYVIRNLSLYGHDRH